MKQTEQILAMLKRGPVTPLQALSEANCFRLAARIHDLKAEGHDIRCDMVDHNDKKFAQYTLVRS